jgi:hypothetical protein
VTRLRRGAGHIRRSCNRMASMMADQDRFGPASPTLPADRKTRR